MHEFDREMVGDALDALSSATDIQYAPDHSSGLSDIPRCQNSCRVT